MLDLKAKLLAAGLVTAEQVKKVEDDEAEKKQRAKNARENRGARSGDGAAKPRDAAPKKPRTEQDHADEKAAKHEHALVEAERWRKRLVELAAAGKSDQYDAVRGWVTRHRMDSKQISEQAERFHFMTVDGSVSHLTVEPDVKEKLAAGEAALVMFMGFNGLEHAVVPKDVALDIRHVKPEWLRALAGVTDAVPPDAADAPAADTPADTEPER